LFTYGFIIIFPFLILIQDKKYSNKNVLAVLGNLNCFEISFKPLSFIFLKGCCKKKKRRSNFRKKGKEEKRPNQTPAAHLAHPSSCHLLPSYGGASVGAMYPLPSMGWTSCSCPSLKPPHLQS
jgi:hypothetical protein